jgi:hypothetical protein
MAVGVGNDGAKAETLRVYLIGNNITDTVKYRPLAELVERRRQAWVLIVTYRGGNSCPQVRRALWLRD